MLRTFNLRRERAGRIAGENPVSILDIFGGRHNREEVFTKVSLLGNYVFSTPREAGLYELPTSLIGPTETVDIPLPVIVESPNKEKKGITTDRLEAAAFAIIELEDLGKQLYKIYIWGRQEYVVLFMLQNILDGKSGLRPILSFEKPQVEGGAR